MVAGLCTWCLMNLFDCLSEEVYLPIGLIVVRWDNKIGTVLEGKYPEDVSVSPDLTMKIYGAHVLGEVREAGFISMKVDSLNIASYFAGIEINYYVALLLKPTEDAAIFEDALIEVASKIVENIENKKFLEKLPELYKFLERYPLLTRDQKIASIVLDPIKGFIFRMLLERGCVSKDELYEEVIKGLGVKTFDINAVLSSFIKSGLIVSEWVEGVPSEVVFLVKDFEILRVPPSTKNIPANVVGVIKNLFSKYEPSSRDVAILARAITDPEIYEIIKVLRTGEGLSMEEIAEKTGLSQDKVINYIGWLKRNNFVTEVMGGGKTIFYLISEPMVVTVYPEYQIKSVIEKYNSGILQAKQVVRYLMFLKESYGEK